ncbi:hypothetical protein HDV01_001957, partial [Terramyces sp. JEL0728]
YASQVQSALQASVSGYLASETESNYESSTSEGLYESAKSYASSASSYASQVQSALQASVSGYLASETESNYESSTSEGLYESAKSYASSASSYASQVQSALQASVSGYFASKTESNYESSTSEGLYESANAYASSASNAQSKASYLTSESAYEASTSKVKADATATSAVSYSQSESNYESSTASSISAIVTYDPFVGPFGTVEVNPSWEAVKTIPDEIDGFKIRKIHIPVRYEHVSNVIPQLVNELNPSLAIHFGVGVQGAIKLETVAHNDNYQSKDIDGQIPRNGKCIHSKDAQDQYTTSINVELLAERMNPNVEIVPSIDAGRFLCEFIYCASLYAVKDGSSLFVHLPPVDYPYSQQELNKAALQLITLAIESLETTD